MWEWIGREAEYWGGEEGDIAVVIGEDIFKKVNGIISDGSRKEINEKQIKDSKIVCVSIDILITINKNNLSINVIKLYDMKSYIHYVLYSVIQYLIMPV